MARTKKHLTNEQIFKQFIKQADPITLAFARTWLDHVANQMVINPEAMGNMFDDELVRFSAKQVVDAMKLSNPC